MGRYPAELRHRPDRVIEERVSTPAASSREPLGAWPRLAVSVAREVTTATQHLQAVYASFA
jgi:hypothetical protein